MKYRVQVMRRPGIADPEGKTTATALNDLGYTEVTGVHFGRDIIVEVEGTDEAATHARVVEMCEKLLANPVIEDYVVERIP
ncbi:MAG: phosphoribosylformylglycinamidine synthase subunit PurS [Actinomycetota bacterium]